jgi:tetraacyldisaccharide 4'-kinase
VAETLGATVHVLDDGFQHLQLERDVDIVMLHPSDLNDEVIPTGRLREPIDALDYADAIVVIDANEEERTLTAQGLSELPGTRVFTATRQVLGPPEDVAGERALFVTGIADAAQAANAVRQSGWLVAGERHYKDHHRYSADDAADIERDAVASGARFVLTTAKDAVRLREVWTSGLPLHIAELRLGLDSPDECSRWLIEAVNHARRARASLERRLREDGSRRAS